LKEEATEGVNDSTNESKDMKPENPEEQPVIDSP